MLIVVDFRFLCKKLSYSVVPGKGGTIVSSFPSEWEEIQFRIMKFLYCLRVEHPEAKIILANDSKPYWRTKWLEKWYAANNLEPVKYKGNRDGKKWSFQTPPADMEIMYSNVFEDGARAIGAMTLQVKGLEADDIFGIIAKTTKQDVIGYTGDSDWAQLVGGNIKVRSLISHKFMEPLDIRLKWIGGDDSDTVKGCPKYKANGEQYKHFGEGLAITHLKKYGDNWRDILDKNHLGKNITVTTLPCPNWDLEVSREALLENIQKYDWEPSVMDEYGVNEEIREQLNEVANIAAFRERIRLQCNKGEQ